MTISLGRESRAFDSVEHEVYETSLNSSSTPEAAEDPKSCWLANIEHMLSRVHCLPYLFLAWPSNIALNFNGQTSIHQKHLYENTSRRLARPLTLQWLAFDEIVNSPLEGKSP